MNCKVVRAFATVAARSHSFQNFSSEGRPLRAINIDQISLAKLLSDLSMASQEYRAVGKSHSSPSIGYGFRNVFGYQGASDVPAFRDFSNPSPDKSQEPVDVSFIDCIEVETRHAFGMEGRGA